MERHIAKTKKKTTKKNFFEGLHFENNVARAFDHTGAELENQKTPQKRQSYDLLTKNTQKKPLSIEKV